MSPTLSHELHCVHILGSAGEELDGDEEVEDVNIKSVFFVVSTRNPQQVVRAKLSMADKHEK